MGRRKDEGTSIRSLTKIAGGKSYAVIIPREYIRKLKWQAKQKLTVELDGKSVIIKDWNP